MSLFALQSIIHFHLNVGFLGFVGFLAPFSLFLSQARISSTQIFAYLGVSNPDISVKNLIYSACRRSPNSDEVRLIYIHKNELLFDDCVPF